MTKVKKHNLGILASKFFSVCGVPNTDFLASRFMGATVLDGAGLAPSSIGVTLPIFLSLILRFKDDFMNYLKLSKIELNNITCLIYLNSKFIRPRNKKGGHNL